MVVLERDGPASGDERKGLCVVSGTERKFGMEGIAGIGGRGSLGGEVGGP